MSRLQGPDQEKNSDSERLFNLFTHICKLSCILVLNLPFTLFSQFSCDFNFSLYFSRRILKVSHLRAMATRSPMSQGEAARAEPSEVKINVFEQHKVEMGGTENLYIKRRLR